VERALFLHRLPAELPAGTQRLYWGAEFCCWRQPAAAATREALAFARAHGLGFSLVTPVLVETFVPRLEKLLDQTLPELGSGDEVVISDLGAIEAGRSRRPELPLVLGRALSGQKRGPRILDLELTSAQSDYFRQGAWYSAEAQRLLAELGIARVELDNLLQGLAPLPQGVAGTLHTPYALVTSSRNCPFRETRSGPCRPTCGEVFSLTTPQSRVPLYQAGNSQFLCNPVLPENPAALGIDRLVEHLQLPA